MASKIAAGLGWPGSSSAAAARGERERDGITETVGEEIFGTEKQMSSAFELQHIARDAASL